MLGLDITITNTGNAKLLDITIAPEEACVVAVVAGPVVVTNVCVVASSLLDGVVALRNFFVETGVRVVVASPLAKAVVFPASVMETGVGMAVSSWFANDVPFAGDLVLVLSRFAKAVVFLVSVAESVVGMVVSSWLANDVPFPVVHRRWPPLLLPLLLSHDTFAFMLTQVLALYIFMYSSLQPHCA